MPQLRSDVLLRGGAGNSEDSPLAGSGARNCPRSCERVNLELQSFSRPNPHQPNAQVFEETGLDISGRFEESDCVEIWVKSGVSQKRTKLFFVPGIDTSTEFAPQARKVLDCPSPLTLNLNLTSTLILTLTFSISPAS